MFEATIIVSTLLVACSPLHQAEAERAAPPAAVETVSHHLQVTLEPDEHRLTVRDSITLPPAQRQAGTQFTLSDALTIGSSTPAVKRISDEAHSVRYALVAPTEDGVLHLQYEGQFDFGLSDQKEEYTRGFRDTRGIVGPEGVFLSGGSHWIADFDAMMIRFTVEVRMPDDWHVISQGSGTSRGAPGQARWESAHAFDELYLVGGPLVVDRAMSGSVETLVFLHETDETVSRPYLKAADRYLGMYEQLIGPYPYDKFALVENFWETGFGMPSFTLLGPQVIRLPFILHSSYPHEILHNWWGNSVFVDYSTGNWCEGLTAYMADHLIKEQAGRAAEYRRDTLQKYRDYVTEGRDFPLAKFQSRHSAATEAIGYGKALMTFHMLRRRIGDDAFRTALADFYKTQRGNRASFTDLQHVFERAAGEDFGPFFKQWLHRTGAPALAISDVVVRETADGFLLSASIKQTQDDPPFVIDVPIQIVTAEGATTVIVQSASVHDTFEIRLDARPETVVVDPMFDVFRHLDPMETPPSIGQIFGEHRILAVLPADALGIGYEKLMEAWRSESHDIEIVLDSDIEQLPDDRAIWILGRANRFASELGIVASKATVRLGDDDVSFGDHTIVSIRRHSAKADKAIGLIAMESEAALAGLARKLPHYGKYSYLAFEGAGPTNVVKGQWPTERSPLIVHLTGQRRSARIEPREPLAPSPFGAN